MALGEKLKTNAGLFGIENLAKIYSQFCTTYRISNKARLRVMDAAGKYPSTKWQVLNYTCLQGF